MFVPEYLENRRLLSVDIAFDAESGLLQVFGKDTSNDLRVTMYNTDAPVIGRITLRSQPQLEYVGLLRGVSVYDKGVLIFNNFTGKSWIDVKSVDVWGNDGADQITMYAWNSPVTARVFGEAGNDTIYATAHNAPLAELSAGSGDDQVHATFSDTATFQVIDAGAGNDVINARGAVVYDPLPNDTSDIEDDSLNCMARTRMILGGEGDDAFSLSLEFNEADSYGYHVFAGAGNDVIRASDKTDMLYGEDGNDSVYAGAGNDYINGGLGDDLLCGEDGDDYLDHGGGTDIIDGGSGRDWGIFGKDDILISVEDTTSGE